MKFEDIEKSRKYQMKFEDVEEIDKQKNLMKF